MGQRSVYLFLVLAVFLAATHAWERAVAPRLWQFPRDHGSHPEYRTEWWYATGNLEDERGEAFGYQFTVFRQGLKRVDAFPIGSSAWQAREFFFGHFTVTDVARQRFYVAEELGRGVQGIAWAREERMEVRLNDWHLEQGGDSKFRLRATGEKHSIELELRAIKPLVLQGDRGLSQKGRELGNASHYYSMTRLASQGTLTINGRTRQVRGESWLDREFSTSALDAGQVGWDWFSLQLNNGEELMLYQLRRADGSADPLSKGVWVDKEGIATALRAEEFAIDVLSRWRSPAHGKSYPAKWRLTLPARQVEIVVTPRLADQELRLNRLVDLAYWEGSVQVSGTAKGKPVRGLGYVELTGYARPLSEMQLGATDAPE